MNYAICGEELAPGLTCQRPYDHGGEHMAEGEIPPSIGVMVAEMMNRAENEHLRARREWRRYRTLNVVFLVLSALMFTSIVVQTL